MAYLLDTNVVINYLNASLPLAGMAFLNTIVDNEPMISVITKMETLGFNFDSIEEQNLMQDFISGSDVLDINNDIVNITIALRKTHKIKLPDAIIAASALIYNLKLITRNTNDFKKIEGLKVVNPFEVV
jgi:predicted nucleic acid-binding protein